MKQADRDTERLGGVDVPSADRLREMHGSPYILHARGGELKEVPAEKVLLPRETNTSPQSVDLKLAPDGTLYSRHRHIICKSIDGGRTWSAHRKAERLGFFEVLPGGAMVGLSTDGEDPARVIVCRSEDEGRSMEKVSAIENPPGCSGGACWIHRLPDGSLLAGVGHSDHLFEEQGDGRLVLISGSGAQLGVSLRRRRPDLVGSGARARLVQRRRGDTHAVGQAPGRGPLSASHPARRPSRPRTAEPRHGPGGRTNMSASSIPTMAAARGRTRGCS